MIMDENSTVNWKDVRINASINIMNAILSSSIMVFIFQFIFKRQVADIAVEYADKLVEELKSDGWTFTYMGANQDSVEVAFNLSIRNSRNFDATAGGTMRAMARDTSTRMNFYSRLAHFKDEMECCAAMPSEERRAYYTAMADEAFDEEKDKV